MHDYGEGVDELIRSRRVDHADIDGDHDTSEFVELYVHTDQLGSVTHLSDGQGVVVESYLYDPFGAPVIFDGTGTEITDSAVGHHHLFTGREFDAETG